MLAKCAAPSCVVPFLHLSDGRLYRLELDPSCRDDSDTDERSNVEEYFWLCAECCREMKLLLDAEGCVIVVPLPDRFHADHPSHFATVSRHAGKLLRSVSIFRSAAEFSDVSGDR